METSPGSGQRVASCTRFPENGQTDASKKLLLDLWYAMSQDLGCVALLKLERYCLAPA